MYEANLVLVFARRLNDLGALGVRRHVPVDGEPVGVAPPEYVIVRKREFFREGGSEKHLRDIEGILRVSPDLVRLPIIEEWVAELGLARQWAAVERGSEVS